MYEPTSEFRNKYPQCLFARSVSDPSENNIWLNVMSSSDQDITFKVDTLVGHVSEVELANQEFDKKVKSYSSLDMTTLEKKRLARNNMHGKNEHSKLLKFRPKEKEKFISTMDILNKQIYNRIKLMQISPKKPLSPKEHDQMVEVILGHSAAFQWNEKDPPGRTKLVTHSVPTSDAPPIVQKQYPISSMAKESLNQQVEQMLKDDIIRPSNSAWRSPVLLIKKKTPDNSIQYRFCIDLKKVNHVTAKDCYPLPLISETVDSLSGCNFFTTLDVDRAFWQIPMKEEDKAKLAFIINGKLYEFNVMPFGSMNAPSTFQRLIDRVLKGLTWRQCLVYIDDVLIFSSNYEQHLKDVDEVLARFEFAGLKLKPSKCIFAASEVEYLGFKISGKGMQITDQKIEKVLNIEPPENNKQLFGFLCSMNYYRHLIPNFGSITAGLYRMSESKGRKCVWTKENIESFETLKQALVTAPILMFPDYKKDFYVQTDASGWALGGVLLQEDDNKILRPVAFCSRKLSETEQRYSTTEREMLAIKYAFSQFKNTIEGRNITFYTDHEPLATMKQLKDPSSRLEKMFQTLVMEKYVIKHIKGDENFLPDFLSRASIKENRECNIKFMELKSSVNWSSEQQKDSTLIKIARLLQSDTYVQEDWEAILDGKRWIREKKNLYLSNNTIYHNNQIVVPNHLKQEVLKMHHDTPFAGHRAFETTLASLTKRYYWNFMPKEVNDYCQSCHQCQSFNYSNMNNRAPLKSIIVSRPFQTIGLDYTGPFFPVTTKGNKHIIFGICHLTKFVIAAATPSFDAQITAEFVFNEIICKLGMVEKFLDRSGR